MIKPKSDYSRYFQLMDIKAKSAAFVRDLGTKK